MKKKEAEKIRAKIDYSKKEGRYEKLTNEEVAQYYRFALGGYVTSGKFIYADTQSMAKYIDALLVLEHLTRIKNSVSLAAAQKEYSTLQSMGYMYYAELNGNTVLCTSEGKMFVERQK